MIMAPTPDPTGTTAPPPEAGRWIADPDNRPGHENYRAVFGGMDYLLAYRQPPTYDHHGGADGDWYLCVQGHDEPHKIDLRVVYDPDTTREQAMAYAARCAQRFGHTDTTAVAPPAAVTRLARDECDYDLLERQFTDYRADELHPVRDWYARTYGLHFDADTDTRFTKIMLVLGARHIETENAGEAVRATMDAIIGAKIAELVNVYTTAVELGLTH
jgi:hypothetical protein